VALGHRDTVRERVMVALTVWDWEGEEVELWLMVTPK
jgi:hypothetical protein